MRKKFLSLLLALALTFALAGPAFAAQNALALPLVVVQGFNAVPLMQGDKQAFLPTDPMTYVNALLRTLPALAAGIPQFFLRRSIEPLSEALIPLAQALFEPLRLDARQNPVGEALTARQYPGSMANYDDGARGLAMGQGFAYAEAYGWDHVYVYTFDWRRDIYELAAGLDEVIQRAKKETGQSRVNISALSMGAAVTCAYLSEYAAKNGFADINNLVYLSPGWQGTSSVSALLTGELTVDFDNLSGQLWAALDGKVNWLLNPLFGFLKQLGAAYFFEALAAPVSALYLRGVIKYWPGIWALCPYEDYDRARAICFPGGGTKEEQALVKSLDKFHKAQGEQAKVLRALQKTGRGFAVVSFYTAPMYAPIARFQHTLWADGVIDTYFTGGFPGLARFPDGKLAAQAIADGHNHLSPDGAVDASACLFPENTWFVRGPYHADYVPGEWPSRLALWLLEGGSRGTVFSNEAYPQFTVK